MPDKTSPVNASVQITYVESATPEVTVDPWDAKVEGPGSVTWAISAPAGATTTITFTPTCPFGEQVSQGPQSFQTTGAQLTTPPAAANTNGTWPYTVTVVTSNRGAAPVPENGAIVVSGNPPS